LVYEPFLGSGTTLAAAELTERACYGLELDPKYADVVVERWQGLTGKKAQLDADGRTFDEIGCERLGARPSIPQHGGNKSNKSGQ
jgi:DNA methylase